MKKFAKVIAAALLAATVAVSTAVSALAAGINADEQRILNVLDTTANLNGNPTKIPVEYYNQAESYFLQSDVDISKTEADEIIKKINDVKAYIESIGVSKWSELSDSQIQKIVGMSNDVVGVIDLELSYYKNAAPGSKVRVTKKGGSTNVGGDDKPVKDTGFETGAAAVTVAGLGALLITAAGVYLVNAPKKEKVVE